MWTLEQLLSGIELGVRDFDNIVGKWKFCLPLNKNWIHAECNRITCGLLKHAKKTSALRLACFAGKSEKHHHTPPFLKESALDCYVEEDKHVSFSGSGAREEDKSCYSDDEGFKETAVENVSYNDRTTAVLR